jgi:hypothetical protein
LLQVFDLRSDPVQIKKEGEIGFRYDLCKAKKNTGIDPTRIGAEIVCPWARIVAASWIEAPESPAPDPA